MKNYKSILKILTYKIGVHKNKSMCRKSGPVELEQIIASVWEHLWESKTDVSTTTTYFLVYSFAVTIESEEASHN